MKKGDIFYTVNLNEVTKLPEIVEWQVTNVNGDFINGKSVEYVIPLTRIFDIGSRKKVLQLYDVPFESKDRALATFITRLSIVTNRLRQEIINE